ncbi:MAG TPA: hypothetical protein VF478_06465 [Anaerolineae bacterium]
MQLNKKMCLVFAAMLGLAALACQPAALFVAQATLVPTRTPRPTFTPIPSATNTLVPTQTATPAPTATATKKPTLRPTTRPPTAIPQAAAPPPPTVSPYEFHANPPLPCTHSGQTYLKGTVYLDKNDANSRYAGAIVALGPSDGSAIWDKVLAGYDGVYSFILAGQGEAKPGTWYIWLVDPSNKRKSDIGGPITTNSLGADDPNSCWASGVDFWK